MVTARRLRTCQTGPQAGAQQLEAVSTLGLSEFRETEADTLGGCSLDVSLSGTVPFRGLPHSVERGENPLCICISQPLTEDWTLQGGVGKEVALGLQF